MIYKEKKIDLFKVPEDYCLAHCISDDFALGAGIAVEFDLKRQLKLVYPNGYKKAGCVRIGKVFNLITKSKCYEKPTYESLEEALIEMKLIAEGQEIKKITMPKIGCGLDKLDWEKVRELLYKVFKETEIEILVCSL